MEVDDVNDLMGRRAGPSLGLRFPRGREGVGEGATLHSNIYNNFFL